MPVSQQPNCLCPLDTGAQSLQRIAFNVALWLGDSGVVSIPSCECPPDGELQLWGKISNNLARLINSLTAGAVNVRYVGIGECLCGKAQILAAINNNLVHYLENVGVPPIGTCLCPPDGELQILSKINNNLVAMWHDLDGSFTGRESDQGLCRCSENEILFMLNQNLSEFLEIIL